MAGHRDRPDRRGRRRPALPILPAQERELASHQGAGSGPGARGADRRPAVLTGVFNLL
ncbi:hypothetical protein [Streptomyces sp. XH2]|uniref:hypothetical protein n=1 Tax=Streptomyces sp. XH2 TaxID=3412483 RepID=UPI003C7E809A